MPGTSPGGSGGGSGTVRVVVPVIDATINVPFNHRTLVSHVIGAVAAQIGEDKNVTNCSLRSCGAELAFDLRVCALPEKARSDLEFYCETPVRYVAASPRLSRLPTTVQLRVGVPEGGARVVVVEPHCSVLELRRLCAVDDDRARLHCDGRLVTDEMAAVSDLGIAPTTTLKFELAPKPSGVSGAIAADARSPWKPSAASVQRRARLMNEMGSISNADLSATIRTLSSTAASSPRRPYRAAPSPTASQYTAYANSSFGDDDAIQIFVADPEDDDFMHEVRVHRRRPLRSILQFLSDPASFAIVCDGREIHDLSTTFQQATGGDDGCIFKFIRRL